MQLWQDKGNEHFELNADNAEIISESELNSYRNENFNEAEVEDKDTITRRKRRYSRYRDEERE